MQECDVMKYAASKVDGGGDDGCSLKYLDIAPVDCAGLFQFLSHVKNLLRIDLSGNNIGCLELAKFLCENNEVIECNLGRNNINDEGVKHLCDALINENCKLTDLNLALNNINDEGVKHLCDALINENCKLTNLSLGGNNINDEQLTDAAKIHNVKINQ